MTGVYDSSLFGTITVDENEVDRKVGVIKEIPKSEITVASLIKIIQHIDLTTLNANDTKDVVQNLCKMAVDPIDPELCLKLLSKGFTIDNSTLHTAAVCVYPSRVKDVIESLKSSDKFNKIRIASVAAGFPSGQYPLKSRLVEIECCLEYGANEIDIVIDRSLVLTEQWEKLFEEIKAMKDVCKDKACMKTILAVGELRNYNDVYKASIISMMAGSDFIKTSTGKETLNATLEFGYVMCKAIKDFYDKTGIKVGLKPAGGIRTVQDALQWFYLVKTELGEAWLNPKLFRIGASGLLKDIQDNLSIV